MQSLHIPYDSFSNVNGRVWILWFPWNHALVLWTHLVCHASRLHQIRIIFLALDELQSKALVLYCRPESAVEEGKKPHGGRNTEDKREQNVRDDTQDKPGSKKKGKGKKGKKGKGRGKKSNREASEKDKAALKDFLESLKGSRRLMVRTSSLCSLLSLLQMKAKPWTSLTHVHVSLADLDAQQRCNALHSAERGQWEESLWPRHQEDQRCDHCGRQWRNTHAAPPPAR